MAKREAIFYEGPAGESSKALEPLLGKLTKKGFHLKRESCPKIFEHSGRCPLLRMPGGITLFGMANIRQYIERGG